MRKLTSIFTIAACLAVSFSSHAESKLYADAKFSLNSVNSDVLTGIDGLRGDDNTSVFGFQGNYEENGITTFIHLQTGAPTDSNAGQAFNQRFFFAGLRGEFGEVAYGRISNIYKLPGFLLDPFYNVSHIGSNGSYATGGATYGLSAATNGFTNNAVQYVSPMIKGKVQVHAGFYLDDSNANDHGAAIGVDYSQDAFKVGFRHASNGDTGTLPSFAAGGNATRLYGLYSGHRWSLATSIEQIDISVADQNINYLYLTGNYNVTDKTTIAGSVSKVDDGAAKGNGLTMGISHMITTNTTLYTNFSFARIAATNTNPSTISIGAIHRFSLGHI